MPPARWLHRSIPALHVDGPDATYSAGEEPPRAHNFHNIALTRTPHGVALSLCEPDFAVLRRDDVYTCNDNTVTTHTCPAGTLCTHDAASLRVQMARYVLEPGFGCFSAADVGPGQQLSQLATPNTVSACPLPAHAAWGPCSSDASDCCVFQCDSGYVHNGTACEPACGEVGETACRDGQYAAVECTDMDAPRYTCAACPARPGSRVLGWSGADATHCHYTPCGAGEEGTDNACTTCPANTFSPPNSSTCTPCPIGTESPTGSAQCVACTLGPGACAPGERYANNISEAVAYFTVATALPPDDAAREMRAACLEHRACLACLPGTALHENACAPCPVGTYQPNLAATACFACADGQITAGTGSTRPEDCVCGKGFE